MNQKTQIIKRAVGGMGALVFFLLTFSLAHATLTDDLFKSGMGIRAKGMGGAATAVGGDANALFYNPAALPHQGFEYTLGVIDIDNRDYTSSRFDLLRFGPFGYGSFGLSTSTESASNVLYGFGGQGGAGFNWGLTYKTATWNLSSGSGQGWSSDLGILLKVSPTLSLGVVGKEIASQRGFVVGSSTRVGVALMPLLDRMIFAGDIEFDETRRTQNLSHFGIELEIAEGLKARVGSDQGLMTAGASLRFLGLILDYALKNRGETSGILQAFSGTLFLGGKDERNLSIIGPKEYVEIDIRGNILGGRDDVSLLGGRRAGLDELLAQLRHAGSDKGISGILIKLTDLGGGLGSTAVVQEIRDAIKEAQSKGKKVVVYIEDSALGDGYYLASAADKIIAPEGATLGGLSKKIEITRLHDLYEKLGIEWQMFTYGKNKDTFSNVKSGLTDGQRKILEGIVSDLQRQTLVDIAKDRKLEVATVKDLGDGRILGAKDAQKIGLIDNLGYYKDATKVAAEILDSKDEIKVIPPEALMDEKDMQDYLFSYFNKVAVIEVNGEIVIGDSGGNLLFGGSYTGAETITDQIRSAVDDPQIKAIIMRLSTPGGSAVASGQVYQEIMRARKKGKVVVASMSDVAASGGYYIASACNSIVSEPATITGSIGVIGQLPILQGLYDKVGVKKEVVKDGAHADMFSGNRAMTSDEVASVSKLQQDTYAEFVAKVVNGRDLPTAEVLAVADGRILTGKQAEEIGLVDTLGGFQTAIDVAKETAKIRGEPILVYFGRPSNFLNPLGASMLKMLGFEKGLAPQLSTGKLNQYKLY